MSDSYRPSRPTDPDELARRLELLERDNDRLRRQVEKLVGPDNPCFDRVAFQNALRFYTLSFMLPLQLLLVPVFLIGFLPGVAARLPMLGPVPLVSAAGLGSGHPGIGLGIVSFGGLGVGVLAFGGLAVGVIAVGGGAIGLVAVGGGSAGIIAIGGGTIGYIALGGGAVGRYALGQNAYGRAVFCMRRQDPEAVELFTRWLPRFKAAVTTPLPVVSLDDDEGKNAT